MLEIFLLLIKLGIFIAVVYLIFALIAKTVPEKDKRLPAFIWFIMVIYLCGSITYSNAEIIVTNLLAILALLLILFIPVYPREEIRWGLRSLLYWIAGVRFEEEAKNKQLEEETS